MRILVAQMARMGDMLQTSPLIHALKQKHPDAHITVMVRNMGKAIAEHNPHVDDIIVYDEDEMFLHLRAQDSDRLLRAYERADGYVRELKEKRFDVAYNCTNSISSAMLLKLADVPRVIGAHLSDDWQFVLRGPWTNYFFTCVFHREYSDINLCDVFGHFAEDAPPAPPIVFEVSDADRRFVTELFGRHGIGPDELVVCFQLGASQESKQWSEAHFAALANRLIKERRARIFLVGVAEEARLGERFARHAPGGAVPLFGKTTIAQLAALLERADALVTNDTGTMHIAAAVQCPTVLVSVGYVHFRETGPYGAGHCAVEWRRKHVGRSDWVPGALEERTQILPEHVLRAVELTLETRPDKPIPQLEESPELADIDLHMTRFAPDGFLEWYPVVRRPITERDLIRIAYRIMWLEHLGAQKDEGIERECLRGILHCYAQTPNIAIDNWAKGLGAAFDQLATLAQQGTKTTEELLAALRKTEGMGKPRQLVRELTRLDEEIRLFGQLHGPCKPLVVIARYERDNLEGADPIALAETTLRIYGDLFARARLMQTKIARVVDVWRARHC